MSPSHLGETRHPFRWHGLVWTTMAALATRGGTSTSCRSWRSCWAAPRCQAKGARLVVIIRPNPSDDALTVVTRRRPRFHWFAKSQTAPPFARASAPPCLFAAEVPNWVKRLLKLIVRQIVHPAPRIRFQRDLTNFYFPTSHVEDAVVDDRVAVAVNVGLEIDVAAKKSGISPMSVRMPVRHADGRRTTALTVSELGAARDWHSATSRAAAAEFGPLTRPLCRYQRLPFPHGIRRPCRPR